MKTKSGVAPLLDNTKDPTSLKFNDEEKANILLTHFSSVFIEEKEGPIPRIPKRTDSIVGDLRITEDMIKVELMQLHTDKSSGPDEIHPCILIEHAKHIVGPVALLFNMSLNQGLETRFCNPDIQKRIS